jgi:hypothetical protein
MISRVRYKEFDQISFADMMVYSKLPEHPFWSNLEKKIDFAFADKLCSVLYSGRGQRPYAPSLKLKIHLIQTYYGLSDRQVEEKIIGDLFIKRFLQLPVDFFGFDHSTIGLDRSRMGAAMFKACHFYILAQMRSHGLWGDHNEQWIIDSFAANVTLRQRGCYRLIQQTMIRIFQHLKRNNRSVYHLTLSSVSADAMHARLSAEASDSDKMLAFSKLVAQAYGLLQWFQLEEVALLFQRELTEKANTASQVLQNQLKEILEQNSRFLPPTDDDASNGTHRKEGNGRYEKIPHTERTKDRMVNAVDPDMRVAKKNKKTTIKGYKVQNVCATSGIVLNVSVIPANEHDRDAMFPMVNELRTFFHFTPRSVLGDTAYGHGKQRALLDTIGIPIVAPVAPEQNPKNLYEHSKFSYDVEHDRYGCPNGKSSYRKYYIVQSKGWQYSFGKQDCQPCPFRSACTTSKEGRRVFHSDYRAFYEAANVYNGTSDGQWDRKKRLLVERKNQELKNDCHLGAPRTRSKKALAVKSYLAAMVVNFKLTLRRLTAPKPGFNRRCAATGTLQ